VNKITYAFDAELWLWEGEGAPWTFLTFPAEVADEIDARPGVAARGFGAVRVDVTIGSTTWATSAFPSRERASLILPIKAQVRKAEDIAAGDTVRVTINLL